MSRRTGSVLLGAVGVLLIGLAGFNFLVPPPVTSAPEQSAGALIGAAVGQVEVRRGGSARWLPVKVGEPLADGDEVRTGLFSEATIHLRGASSVTINPNTVFVVGEERVKRSSFELGEGQIVAAIPDEAGREYEFRSRGSEAVASAERGEFSLVTDGKGTVVVDSKRGAVKLRSKGKQVEVVKGKRSIVRPEQTPSDPLPVPASVALQVRWPARKTLKTKARIKGTTAAAAIVMVNGIQVRADGQGDFSLEVPLREGKNQLVVSSTDAAGNSVVQQSPEIVVDTRPPDLKVDAKGLWK